METPSLAALWPELLALVLLIGAAAFFSGSESAIVSLSRLRARTLAERGVPGSAALLRLLENRNRFLTSMLIGNTIVLLAADSLSTLIFIREGVPHAPEISTGIMVVLMLIFGEIGPKTIAVAHNEAWAARLAPLLERITWVMTPLNSAFLFVTGGIVRLFGVSNAQHRAVHHGRGYPQHRRRRRRAERPRRRRARDDPLDHRVRRYDRARGDEAAGPTW